MVFKANHMLIIEHDVWSINLQDTNHMICEQIHKLMAWHGTSINMCVHAWWSWEKKILCAFHEKKKKSICYCMEDDDVLRRLWLLERERERWDCKVVECVSLTGSKGRDSPGNLMKCIHVIYYVECWMTVMRG